MKVVATRVEAAQRARRAFSLLEVVLSAAVLSFMLVALYGGIASSFAIIQTARENLRATQIMLERVEGVRLYNWNQLVYSNMIPTWFTNYYYPLAGPGESKGVVYVGKMEIQPVTLNPPATYGDNMRRINVTIYWTNYYGRGGKQISVRSRNMVTYSARFGIQNYVYYN